MVWLNTFLTDEEGLTIVEYAVAGGLITAALALSVLNLSNNVASVISDIADYIE